MVKWKVMVCRAVVASGIIGTPTDQKYCYSSYKKEKLRHNSRLRSFHDAVNIMNRAFDTYVHCAQDKYYHIAVIADIVSKKALNHRLLVHRFSHKIDPFWVCQWKSGNWGHEIRRKTWPDIRHYHDPQKSWETGETLS